MAKHGKTFEMSTTVRTVLIVASVLAVLIGIGAVLTFTGVMDSVAALFTSATPSAPATTTGETTQTTVTTTTTQPTTPPEPDPEFFVPAEMKGVWITPGVDYLTSKKDTVSTVKTQIDKAFAAIEDWQFNTVLLPLHLNEKALYPSQYLESRLLTDTNGAAFDPLQYILTKARERDLYVYGIVSLHVRDAELWDPRVEGDMDRIVDSVYEQATRYAFDGYFLSDFTFSGSQVKKGEEQVAEEALDTLISRSAAAIRKANRNFYVGLLSNGIWAHKSVNDRGSETGEYYEEFTDGRADTLDWISSGIFDCVLVQNSASTNHPTAPFQKVLRWWDGVAQQYEIPLYIAHSSNTIGSYKVGWKLTDQLAQQYLYCKAATGWKGSVYDSVTALRKDTSGIADALKKAYDGTLNEDFIYKTLTVTSPNKTTYLTTSSTVKFEGGGDTNFPLTVNGEAVELSEHGFFTKTFTLAVGKNTFTFSHKGVTKTYTITYKATLVESVSPSMNMKVDGGSPFIISAVARKGSVVKATLGKQTVTLTEMPGKDDEGSGGNTDFATYSGTITLPAGIVAQEQTLGTVSVEATHNGITETMNGGTIVVEALPVPTTTPTTTATSTGTTTTVGGVTTSTMSGIVVGTTGSSAVVTTTTTRSTNPTIAGGIPVPGNSGNKQVVVITSNYAETFSGGKLTDDFSRPYNSYLPKGSWDYLDGKVYNGKYSYYLLSSGKRVYMRDAKVVNAGELSVQQLKNGAVNLTDTHTVFHFNTAWRVPVYVSAKPQSYYRDTTSGTPNYGLEHYGQTMEYVDVTFHFVSAVPAAPDLSSNPLFKKAEWIKGSNNTYTLRLTLRKKGGYYGVSPLWNGDGTFTLSFLNPVDISQNTGTEKLKGIRILLDPGHGSPNDKPHEAPFNLDYANTLKEKLESLGATVDMTRTGPVSNNFELQDRVDMANNGGYHMYISVHMNGLDGKSTGASVWYYYDFSYAVSKYVFDEMHKAETPYGVGTTKNGVPRSSGTNWSTLYVNRTIHDCPSILLECAFLDNPKDKECLIDPVYRDKLMQAVTDGVIKYFSQQK